MATCDKTVSLATGQIYVRVVTLLYNEAYKIKSNTNQIYIQQTLTLEVGSSSHTDSWHWSTPSLAVGPDTYGLGAQKQHILVTDLFLTWTQYCSVVITIDLFCHVISIGSWLYYRSLDNFQLSLKSWIYFNCSYFNSILHSFLTCLCYYYNIIHVQIPGTSSNISDQFFQPS